MTMITVWSIDGEPVADALGNAARKLDSAGGELVLDFSSVRRLDAGGLRAMEALAAVADQKAVKVALRGVSVEIYKVLKLVKLAPRFFFLT